MNNGPTPPSRRPVDLPLDWSYSLPPTAEQEALDRQIAWCDRFWAGTEAFLRGLAAWLSLLILAGIAARLLGLY